MLEPHATVPEGKLYRQTTCSQPRPRVHETDIQVLIAYSAVYLSIYLGRPWPSQLCILAVRSLYAVHTLGQCQHVVTPNAPRSAAIYSQ